MGLQEGQLLVMLAVVRRATPAWLPRYIITAHGKWQSKWVRKSEVLRLKLVQQGGARGHLYRLIPSEDTLLVVVCHGGALAASLANQR